MFKGQQLIRKLRSSLHQYHYSKQHSTRTFISIKTWLCTRTYVEKCSDWVPKITINAEQTGCQVKVLEKLMFAMVKFYKVFKY